MERERPLLRGVRLHCLSTIRYGSGTFQQWTVFLCCYIHYKAVQERD